MYLSEQAAAVYSAIPLCASWFAVNSMYVVVIEADAHLNRKFVKWLGLIRKQGS